MGKRTHGPQLLHAIEGNDHAKVHELLAVQIKNKVKIRDLVTAEVRRLPQDTIDVPLILAASIPDPSILKYFITKHSVDVNFVYKYGYHGKLNKSTTPLIHAIRRGLYATVEVLLALNADTGFADHKGRTALHHAIRRANYRMAKLIVARGGNPNAAEKGQNSPLHVATKLGHVELVRLLLKYGGDLYKRGMFGALPIHIAAKEGHVALVQLFAQHEVNINTKVPCFADEREKTPLHVAAEEGHNEMVMVLIEHFGADVNVPDSEGETALHCTVIREYDQYGMKSKDDYAETAKVIIRCGGDVNMRNGRGETPLHLAARNEFHKVIDLLIIAGADPFIEDNDRNKPIDLVAEEDTVSKQTLKRAMEDREKFVTKLMEMRGLSASLTSVPGRGMSLNNLPGVMNSLSSRTMSTSGLSFSDVDGRSGLYTEDGYLLPRANNNMGSISGSIAGSVSGSINNIPGLIGQGIPGLNMPMRNRQNSISSLSSFQSMASQQPQNPYGLLDPYASLDSDSKDSVVSESAAGRRYQRKKSVDSLLNHPAKFDYSSDSSQYDENERRQRPRSSSVSQIPGYLEVNGKIPEQLALMLQQQHQQQQQQALLLKQRIEGHSSGFVSGSALRSSNRSLQAYNHVQENHNLQRLNSNRSSGKRDSGSSQRTSTGSQHSLKRSLSSNSDMSSVKEVQLRPKAFSSFGKDASPTTPSPRSSTSSGHTPVDNTHVPSSNMGDEDIYENMPDEDVATEVDAVYTNVEENKPPPPAPRKRVFPPQPTIPSPQFTPQKTPQHTPQTLQSTPQVASLQRGSQHIPPRTTSQPKNVPPVISPPTTQAPPRLVPLRTAPQSTTRNTTQPSNTAGSTSTSSTTTASTSAQSSPIKPDLRELALKLAEQMTPKPAVRSLQQDDNTLVNGYREGMSDSDDTFFDDESFDTVSDYGEDDRPKKPSIAPKPAVRKLRPKQPPPAPPAQTKSPEKPNDPKVQSWLEEQAEYTLKRQEEINGNSPPTEKPQVEVKPNGVAVINQVNSSGPVSHSSPSTTEKVSHSPDFDSMSDISSVSAAKKKTKKKKTKKTKEKKAAIPETAPASVSSPKLGSKPAPPPKPAGYESPLAPKKTFKKVNKTVNKQAVPAHIALEESFDISMDDSMTWDEDNILPKSNNVPCTPGKGKVECEYVEMNSPEVIGAMEDLGKEMPLSKTEPAAVPNSGHQMANIFAANRDTVIRQPKPTSRNENSFDDLSAENRRHSSTKDRYVEQPGFSEVPARYLERSGRGATDLPEVRVKRSMSDSDVLEHPPCLTEAECLAHDSSKDSTYEELPVPGKRRVKIGGEQSVDPSTLKPPPNHDHRRVVYNAGGKPRVSVVGGNSDGVYVHRIDPGSDAELKGLLEGDQILKINGRSVKGMTKEEVTLFLMGLFDTVDLVVRYKKDRYMSILKNGGMGDSFFVRAWFNYKPLQSGEVKISKGDIFSVRDTMPDGRMGSWRVLKVNAKTNEPQNGFIPNEARAEQVALASFRKEEAHVFKEQRGGFIRRSIRRAKSADRLGKETEAIHKSHNLQDVRTYERVEQRAPGFIRPVVLLGLFCDVALDRLVENSPGIFQKAPTELEKSGSSNNPAAVPINVAPIKAIMDIRKHCLMIVSPKSIEFLQNSNLYPIVIYLSPGSKMVVKTLRNKLAPNFEKKTAFMYDEAINFEKQYVNLFTATVTYTTDDSWFTLLLDTIQRIQNQPLWQPILRPDGGSEDSSSVSDTSEFPQGRQPTIKPFGKVESIPDPIRTALQRHNLSDDPLKPPSQTSLTYNGFFMEETPSSPTSGRPPTGNFTRVGSTRPPQRGHSNFRPNHSADELTLEPNVHPVPRSILKKRSASDAAVLEPFILGQSESSPNLASPPTPENTFPRKGSLGAITFPSPRSPSPNESHRSTSSLNTVSPPGVSPLNNNNKTMPVEDVFMQQVMSQHIQQSTVPRQRGRAATRQIPNKAPSRTPVQVSNASPVSKISPTSNPDPSPLSKKDEQWKVVVSNMLKNLTSAEQASETIDELEKKSPEERLQCIQDIIGLWNRSRVNPNTIESEI